MRRLERTIEEVPRFRPPGARCSLLEVNLFVPKDAAAANTAMEEGRYAEAARLYEASAVECHRASEPLWMKMNALLAVKAYVHAADPANAVRFATATVEAIQAGGHAPEVPGFAAKALESMRLHGFAADADALSAHVGQLVGAAWNDPAAAKFPAFCSNCGAAVKPAEVVRPTPSTVACRYCGASLAR